jgi:hypothetical protein
VEVTVVRPSSSVNTYFSTAMWPASGSYSKVQVNVSGAAISRNSRQRRHWVSRVRTIRPAR